MKTKIPSKSHSFVVTNWNCNEEAFYEKLVTPPSQVRFIAWGLEHAPSTGKPHHQAYVYFHNARSTSKRNCATIGKMFGDIHCNVECMLGSFQHNESYCSKEGQLNKFGDEPKQGLRGDLNETRDLILDGTLTADDVCAQDPSTFHQYGRTLDRLESIALRKKFRTEMTKCTWYTGPSGAGKSHKIFEDYISF